jgi:hypothetical protein
MIFFKKLTDLSIFFKKKEETNKPQQIRSGIRLGQTCSGARACAVDKQDDDTFLGLH